MPVNADREIAIRLAAFAHLERLQERLGDEALPWRELNRGFPYQGRTIRLLGPQGIFKPAQLVLPLSITTAPPRPDRRRPYEDIVRDDAIIYRYRGTDPFHRDNLGLRELMQRQWPLIYFHGIASGVYLAFFPVYIVADDPGALAFTAMADVGLSREDILRGQPAKELKPRRQYVTKQVLCRVHQRSFRERVLTAYRRHCAVCRLHHAELLDAAHIIGDRDGGEPIVTNGLSLCKIHHAAFDRNILGITPDYEVRIRLDILEETDGPMLKHGLQELHGSRIILPRRRRERPDPDRLAARYAQFRCA